MANGRYARNKREYGQRLTIRLELLPPDEGHTFVLEKMGFAVTKLYNTARWHMKEAYEREGKTLTDVELQKILAGEENIWYRNLHSDSAIAVLQSLWDAFKSFFQLRRNGDKTARPPGFRRKNAISTIPFKERGFKIETLSEDGRSGVVRLSLGPRLKGYLAGYDGPHADLARQAIADGFLHLPFKTYRDLKGMEFRRLRVKPKDGRWLGDAVLEMENVPGTPQRLEDYRDPDLRVIYGDPGIVNLVTLMDEDGRAIIVSGRAIIEEKQRWQRRNSKRKSKRQRDINNRERKQAAKEGRAPDFQKVLFKGESVRERRERIKHQRRVHNALHLLSKATAMIVSGYDVWVYGDVCGLGGIRKGRDGRGGRQRKQTNKKARQKIYGVPLSRFLYQVSYKARMMNPRLAEERVKEHNTSNSCCLCGQKEPEEGAFRKHRGLFVCDDCQVVLNADVNGVANIAHRFAHKHHRYLCLSKEGGVVGRLTAPSVIRLISLSQGASVSGSGSGTTCLIGKIP